MDRRIIRSLDDKLQLVLEDSDIFWIKAGKKVRNQKNLFAKYNPLLNEKLAKLREHKKETINRETLVEIFGLASKNERRTITHYLNNIKPELLPVKRMPLPIPSAYVVLADFMPIIEGWQTSRKVADEIGISKSSVNNYCQKKLVEAVPFLKNYWLSPQGKARLKEIRAITNPSLKELKKVSEVAVMLGISGATVKKYISNRRIFAERYDKGFRLSDDSINELRNIVRKREKYFVFGDETYYSQDYAAKQTIKKRKIKDSNERTRIQKRFNHLIKKYPTQVLSIKKNGVRYVGEKTKNLLMELMTLTEASAEIGVSRYKIRNYMDRGILGKITIGTTDWTTYSSVVRYKQRL